MGSAETNGLLAKPDSVILVTGAAGFIGPHVVSGLVKRGFRNIRCLARPASDTTKLSTLLQANSGCGEVVRGNLLSPADCAAITRDAAIIYHLAAARGEKSYPDAFMNSVVTTRNLLDAAVAAGTKRFVVVSSFAVYNNRDPRGVLDETSPVEPKPELRGEAYCYAKARQEDIVARYGREKGLSYSIVRPGYVYGPGNEGISSRVGIGTFGIFLHLGGGNRVPLTYVENCAEAIVLAGLRPEAHGQVFNVVDDQLPTSRQFLREYKRKVRPFKSIYLPKPLSYLFCLAWERYSNWSQGQLPPAYNTRMWHAYWKGGSYSNAKLKNLLGWTPAIPTPLAMDTHFAHCRKKFNHA